MEPEKSARCPVVSPGPDGECISGLPYTGHRIQHFLDPVKSPGVFMYCYNKVADLLIILGNGLERVVERECRVGKRRIESLHGCPTIPDDHLWEDL